MTDSKPQVGDGFVMPSIAQQLKKICVDAHFTDPNLILDVYLVVANQGKASFLPDEDLMDDIERTDPKYWDVKTDISRRKEFLDQLAQSKYMQALVKLGDPLKAVLTFVDHMKKALAAKQKVGQRGQQITHNSGSPTDGGYWNDDQLDAVASKASDPAMDFDRLLSLNSTMQALTEDDGASAFMAGAADVEAQARQASGCGGRTAWTEFTTEPGRMLAQAVVEYGIKLPSLYPALFENYTKVLEDLGMGKLKEKDVDHDAKHKRDDQIEELDKLSTVDASEVASETFDKRLADKSLVIKNDREEEQGMSHVFILLDVSASMMDCDLGGRVCRAFAANVITLALLNFAFKEKYKVWVLPFEGTVSNVQSAETRAQALDLMKWLGGLNYDGGGTDIEGAVLKAYRLTQSDPTYNKADIVLVTDGVSPISDRLMKEKPARTKLRAMILNDGSHYAKMHMGRLHDACDAYHNITWDNASNTFSVGNALHGISGHDSKVD